MKNVVTMAYSILKGPIHIAKIMGITPTFIGMLKKAINELLRKSKILHSPFIELEVLKVLSKAKKNSVFVDIGAYEGLYSVYCADKGLTVIAFEPNPTTFIRLNRKLSNYNNAVCYNLALGNRNKIMQLHIPEAAEQSSLLQREGRTVKVRVAKLDDFDFIHPDIIKIDTEGYEYYVLTGMQITIEKYRPLIILEFHSIENLQRCKSWLKKRGYVVKLLDCWNQGHILAITNK